MDWFPYDYRPGQRELVRFISGTVSDAMCPVVEAGTGTGKTVSSLAGALSFASSNGMKVVYLTRTKSQQAQVVRECAALGALCAPLRGRSASGCPLMRGDPDLQPGTSEEISRLCSRRKSKRNGECGCGFFARLEDEDIGAWVEILRSSHPGPEEFARLCEDAGVCPFELTKMVLPQADVVAASYPFMFVPPILEKLVEWTGTPLHRMVVIVDEAHNLPDYLRETMTYEYSFGAMALAEKEARDNGDQEVQDGLLVTDIVDALRASLATAVTEYLIDDDGLLPPYFLEDELMSRLGITSVSIRRICAGLEELGEIVSDRKAEENKLPRSYIGSMGRFIRAWMEDSDESRIHLVTGGDNPCFQSYCMDPSGAAGPLNACYSSIHMSGTLAPLDAYIRELGLERPVPRTFPCCFPPENLLTLYSDEVSMRYEDRSLESNYSRIRQILTDTVRAVRVNTAVFFPSFAFMDRMVADGVPEDLGRPVHYERRGMPQGELMEEFERFRSSEGDILFCVTGGRISEGLDFPDKSLELAIVIGIPYPKPTAKMRAMTRYYDRMFGDGRLYVSIIPATRKIRQSIGRLIRSETDRGVAAVLDRRAASIRDIDAMQCSDIPGAARAFLGDGGRQRPQG